MLSQFRNIFTVTVLAILLAGVSFSNVALGQEESRYNEVFDSNGQVREHYQGIIAQWANRVHHMQTYEAQTYQQFKRGKQDSNAINDLPRMIPKVEYDEMVKGVHQRERAIQAFLHDHYSGVKLYDGAGVISKELVHSIIVRNGEDGYQNILNGQSPMNFLYGPDLIRGPNGIFYALEDNLGFVGGFGDIVLAQEISEKLYPEIAKQYDYVKAIDFYHQLLARYRQQASQFGGKLVFYSDPHATDDSEEIRTMELFSRLGIEVLSPKSNRKFSYEAEGVFVQDRDGQHREKVGFIILNLEHADADLSHPAVREKAILDNAAGFVSDKKEGPKALRLKVLENLLKYDPTKKDKVADLKNLMFLLKDTGYRVTSSHGMRENKGLNDAILGGRVGSSYTPGAEFVGDKQIYTYMEKFIRFYLHEEPIIRNVETYMLNIPGTQKIDDQILDKIFGTDRKGENFRNWVIKPVDGRGGEGIIFGSQTKASDIPGIIEKMKESPHKLQVQRNTPPSMMPGNRIIDTRALTYSTKQGAIVSSVPWLRAATADRSLLINVSAGGAVVPVFVTAKKAKGSPVISCEKLFASGF